ncbi:MAG: alpha-galactosidase [Dysgonamonadaceae bacterium]|nr:alpha-galactosidase [Dysgonamonadaceae bacterium]MDD4727415.1 alpha-galactosidase [Dysgonamonadaceae bacterium]
MNYKTLFFVILFTVTSIFCSASIKDCYAKLDDSLLSIGNNQIERIFLWNDGQLITTSIQNKQCGKIWTNQNKTNDLLIPGITGKVENSTWSSSIKEETPISPTHLEVIIEYNVAQLQIKRVFRIYPDCPAIATDTYLKSSTPIDNWDVKQNVVIDQLSLPGKHWKVESVEFFDTSDDHNTFVEKTSRISYKVDSKYKGNLLFARNLEDNNGLFFLKESPCSINQLYYPGYDYVTKYGAIKQVGIGIKPADLFEHNNEWIKAYSSVIGVYNDTPNGHLIALRNYQKNIRILQEDRDDMIVMNTWGDRGDLKRLTEDFCIEQMQACSRFGITHFQIDWGWQEGSKNKTSSIDIWSPSKKLFPNGLNNIIKIGEKLGVELCLYLSPKLADDNAAWEEDADALINMYKNHGVRIFKVDGQKMQNKTAEINTRKMYDKVMKETNYEVLFNLDITNAPRGGYFYMNETGNLFVENRYTAFETYYPYQTLRNLWMLSNYVPSERLQFEFLNKWKYVDKYSKDDPFSPSNYSMDYLFATTMVAQPLAFFDASDLPVNAFENKDLIKDYRKIQHDLHNGYIFPIGNEPNGRGWTGFQSLQDSEGYFIIFRENNDISVKMIETFIDEGIDVELQSLQGERVTSTQKTGKSGMLTFSLPEKNSFEIYKYIIK